MITLDQKTLVPISAIGVILSLSVGGAWWASAMHIEVKQLKDGLKTSEARYDEVVNELRSVNETLVEIKTIMKGQNRGR